MTALWNSYVIPYEKFHPDLRRNVGEIWKADSVFHSSECITNITDSGWSPGGFRAVYGSKYLNEIKRIPGNKNPP